WSFFESLWLSPYFVSDDGKCVAHLSWRYVDDPVPRKTDCIVFRNQDGPFRSYTFDELCPNPANTWLSGDGSIPNILQMEWYTEASQDGDLLRVSTTDLYEYTFSLSDGGIVRKRLLWGNLLYHPLRVLLLAGIGALAVVVLRRLIRYCRTRPRFTAINPT